MGGISSRPAASSIIHTHNVLKEPKKDDDVNIMALLIALKGAAAERSEEKLQTHQRKKRAAALLRIIMEKVQKIRGNSSDHYANAVQARKLVEAIAKDFGAAGADDVELRKVVSHLSTMAADMKKLEEVLDRDKKELKSLEKDLKKAEEDMKKKERQLKSMNKEFDNTTWWPWNLPKKIAMGVLILKKRKELADSVGAYEKKANEYQRKIPGYRANMSRLNGLHAGRSEELKLKAERMEQEANMAAEEHSQLIEKFLNTEVLIK